MRSEREVRDMEERVLNVVEAGGNDGSEDIIADTLAWVIDSGVSDSRITDYLPEEEEDNDDEDDDEDEEEEEDEGEDE